jgi:DNA-binding MarR family transcriptional regulator
MSGKSLASDIDLVRDASRRLVRELGFMRPTLAGTDLPPSAVHALIEIGARKSLTARALSEILILEKSSVSRMLRKLIERGEVTEGASTTDGRAKPLALTARGRATLGRIDGFARRQVSAALGEMPPAMQTHLAMSLDAYARALKNCRTETQAHQPDPADE